MKQQNLKFYVGVWDLLQKLHNTVTVNEENSWCYYATSEVSKVMSASLMKKVKVPVTYHASKDSEAFVQR